MKNNTTIANFNVTFGEKDEPMLSHFEDVILPAFKSGLKRIQRISENDSKDEYYFMNVQLCEEEGDCVLFGQLVKDTEVRIQSKIVNNKLVSANEHYPSAPYSIFCIFLRNHRMILIRNEKESPDIRSFRVTVNSVLNKFIALKNKKENLNILPKANVNIIDIPTRESWNAIFKNAIKVTKLELKFFPLNGDKNYNAIVNVLTEDLLPVVGAKNGKVSTGVCQNPDGVEEIVSNLDGVMDASVVIDYKTRKGVQIKNNMLREKTTFSGDEEQLNNPNNIVSFAKKIDAITNTSEENQQIYDHFLWRIKDLIDRKR